MPVTFLDEDGSLVTRPDLQPVLTTLFRSWLLLFSMTGRTKSSLGVLRSRSVKKDKMYVQESKKRKTGKLLQEKAAAVGTHDTKERDIASKNENVVF